MLPSQLRERSEHRGATRPRTKNLYLKLLARQTKPGGLDTHQVWGLDSSPQTNKNCVHKTKERLYKTQRTELRKSQCSVYPPLVQSRGVGDTPPMGALAILALGISALTTFELATLRTLVSRTSVSACKCRSSRLRKPIYTKQDGCHFRCTYSRSINNFGSQILTP